jgi:hypothetical protein
VARSLFLSIPRVVRLAADLVPSARHGLFGEVPARMDSIDAAYLNPEKEPPPRHRKLLKLAVDATHALPAHPLIPRPEFNSAVGAVDSDYDGTRSAREVPEEIEQKLTALVGS